MGLAARQLAMLRRMAALEPAPSFMGGFAEDALLAGRVTRAHGDIDWLLPRRELEVRLGQVRQLGFRHVETWGESAPGEPFYLHCRNGDLKLELGVLDEIEERFVIRVYKLFFDIDGRAPAAGYQVWLPADLFDHPPVAMSGIRIRSGSPLGLYQIRAGIASQGSFGTLSQRQRESMAQLKKRFFPGATDEELQPRIEQLS